LGFEFRWGTDRQGQARLKRRTARKKLRSSIKRVAEWCKQNRHRRVGEQFKLLNAKLRGYYNYYGVRGNYASLNEFYQLVQRLHLKWLNRRSQPKLQLGRLPRAETALRTRTTTHQCPSATSMSLALLAEASVHEEPVRENCTPGSVRGLSGDWQSYRDPSMNHIVMEFVYPP